ncbi:unnamed protein product [Fusarium graminearum]|uniref:Uncharacterized protein n=1 Tax=Gibberella zeae TaxID=5518 RepID=A0A8H3KMM0_GIBZA|nr:unnamed protein product [Fusarium graminearum]CAG2004757.1 unnamed protein product [Fusarium graminearum]
METLLGVRLYMRQQQAMIVEAVSVLSRDPGIVHRRDGWATTRLTTSLSRFMTQATGHDTSMAAAKFRCLDTSGPLEEMAASVQIDKTVKRLTKEKEDAMSAVNHELETLKKDFKSLEEETKVKNAEIIKVQKEKQDELSALRKDKDATYKALEDLYKSLKESPGTLTKDNAALTTQNGSLTTKLQDKNSAYTSLTRERDALKTENEATAVKYTALMTKWNDLDGINDTLKTKMRWAGLT